MYTIYVMIPQTTSPPESVALENNNTAPWIGMFDGGGRQYFIFVEKIVVCLVNSLCKALYLWFSLHCIFHLRYHPKVQECGLFFQEFIFGIPQNTKKTTTYLSICTDIQKLTMD